MPLDMTRDRILARPPSAAPRCATSSRHRSPERQLRTRAAGHRDRRGVYGCRVRSRLRRLPQGGLPWRPLRALARDPRSPAPRAIVGSRRRASAARARVLPQLRPLAGFARGVPAHLPPARVRMPPSTPRAEPRRGVTALPPGPRQGTTVSALPRSRRDRSQAMPPHRGAPRHGH